MALWVVGICSPGPTSPSSEFEEFPVVSIFLNEHSNSLAVTSRSTMSNSYRFLSDTCYRCWIISNTIFGWGKLKSNALISLACCYHHSLSSPLAILNIPSKMKSSALIESLFVAELHEGRLGSLPRPMGGKSFSENDGSVASPFPISPLFMRCLPELKGIGSCAPPKRANECSPNPDEHPLPCGTVSCLTFSLGREPSLDGLVPVSSPGFKNAVDFFPKNHRNSNSEI
jgi:hypothetical protein